MVNGIPVAAVIVYAGPVKGIVPPSAFPAMSLIEPALESFSASVPVPDPVDAVTVYVVPEPLTAVTLVPVRPELATRPKFDVATPVTDSENTTVQ